jgi:hypothetical protein
MPGQHARLVVVDHHWIANSKRLNNRRINNGLDADNWTCVHRAEYLLRHGAYRGFSAPFLRFWRGMVKYPPMHARRVAKEYIRLLFSRMHLIPFLAAEAIGTIVTAYRETSACP